MKKMTTPTDEEFEEYLSLFSQSIRHIWAARNLIEQAVEQKEELKRNIKRYGVELTREQIAKQDKLEFEIWDMAQSFSVLQATIKKLY